MLVILALFAANALLSPPVRAWGSEGHYQVGKLALRLTDPDAASRIWELLGSRDPAELAAACDWPDRIQNTPHWAWAAPQHYVNIPRAADRYERDRDCPDGLCVTEAIKKYAMYLADPARDDRSRWQAFAWLCHLTGDLHQPLHAAYLDDRGGNNVNITYRGEEVNLHQFWDGILIRERLAEDSDWQKNIPDHAAFTDPGEWSLSEVDDWTSESFTLVGRYSYPPHSAIMADFADQSWLLIRKQWVKAGQRLAQILNATLGDGKVLVDEPGNREKVPERN